MDRTSRVRELRLTLGVDESDAGQVVEIRRLAEQRLVHGVLDACDRTVHAALGDDALVFVRHVDLRLRLARVELDAPEVLARLGQELGQVLLAKAEASRPERGRPPRDAEIAVFAGEAHLRAAYLAADADGDGGAWYFAALRREGDVWGATIEGGPELLGEVLGWLVALDAAPVVLERLDAPALRRAAEALPLARWPGPLAAAARAAIQVGPTVDPAVPSWSTPDADAAPAAPAGLRSPDLAVPGENDVADSASHAFPPGEGPPPAPADVTSGEPADAQRTKVPAGEPSMAVPEGPTTRPVPAPAAEPSQIATAFGGLFYLAGCVLEIELAEHVYFAGVLEGRFLIALARLLVGDARDPAPRLFGGAAARADDPGLAAVAPWAAEEIWSKGRRALADWLRRRALPCPLDDELAEALEQASAPLLAAAGELVNDATTARLVARSAALVARAFAARLGRPLEPLALRRYLAVPARIELSAEVTRVVLPMSAVDVQLRLAGLDFTPGWIPWLRRKLIIDFDGDGGP